MRRKLTGQCKALRTIIRSPHVTSHHWLQRHLSEKPVVPQPVSLLKKSMGSFKMPGLHSWKFHFKRQKATARNLYFFQNSLASLPAEPCLGIAGRDTIRLHIWL